MQKLTGLRPQAYEHPSDKVALDALTTVPGLDLVTRKLSGWGFEPLLRVQLTGSYLRVTRDSFPDLQRLFSDTCDRLDISAEPELYIGAGIGLNAFTAGVERPIVVLGSEAVDALDPDELVFVMGHEVGHVKSGHRLYYDMAEFLPAIGATVGAATFGLGELVSRGIQVALAQWKRMSEFTADRAGLLACQSAEAALRTLMKFAGLPRKYYQSVNAEDFLAQARQFQAMDQAMGEKLAKWLSAVDASHPWMVARAQQLLLWIDSGEYEAVLKDPPQLRRAVPVGAALFCTQCGRGVGVEDRFCTGCGKLTPGQRAVGG